MMFLGWLNIYSTTSHETDLSPWSFQTFSGKQIVWIALAIVSAIVLVLIDHRTYDVVAYLIYGIWIVILLLPPLFTTGVKGSVSWIPIGPFRFQPAEWAKCITALAIAKWMSRYEYRLKGWRDLVVPIIFLIVPAIIISVWEKETGSALVFAAFFLMFYREGMSGYVLLIGAAAVILFILVIRLDVVQLSWGIGNVGIIAAMVLIMFIALYFLLFRLELKKESLILTGIIILTYGISCIINIWIPVNFNIISTITATISALFTLVLAILYRNRDLAIITLFIVGSVIFSFGCKILFPKLPNHQKQRIEVILGLREDPTGVGYNAKQAGIAIGSGGITGKGFRNGTQTSMKYVPEQHTDFIFTTIGEEWGFMGTFAVLALYVAFILRLIQLSERQKDMFSQIYGYCVVSIFIAHIVINIGMVIGLLPVVGIPLPFYSYGGSSMLGFTMLLFIFLNLDAARVEKL